MDINLNELRNAVSQLAQRVGRLENTVSESDLGDVRQKLERISRAIDGERENKVEGLTEAMSKLREQVAAMRLEDVKREAKLDGMSLAVKVMAVATTGTAVPQLLSFLTNLF